MDINVNKEATEHLANLQIRIKRWDEAASEAQFESIMARWRYGSYVNGIWGVPKGENGKDSYRKDGYVSSKALRNLLEVSVVELSYRRKFAKVSEDDAILVAKRYGVWKEVSHGYLSGHEPGWVNDKQRVRLQRNRNALDELKMRRDAATVTVSVPDRLVNDLVRIGEDHPRRVIHDLFAVLDGPTIIAMIESFDKKVG